MDTTMKVQQWWIEHDVNQSLSYCLGASLPREAGETKLQEMPSGCMMTCRQKLLFVLYDKQMKLLFLRR
uniref:Uncharacterized protein n=1 Tax=Arundo donax TaxID=35708 RepID=A0A0A9CEP5_ARUDO